MITLKDPDYFFKLQKSFKKIPYSQSRGWYSYVNQLKTTTVFFVNSEQDLKIACWGVEHKIPMTGKKILVIPGECYKSNLGEQEIKDFYEKLFVLDYQGVEINSGSYYNINFEIGLKLAGYHRPLGSFSSNLSIEVDFEYGPNFDNNWKGNIRKGFKNQLNVVEIKEFDKVVFLQIFGVFEDMSRLKGLNHHNKDALNALLLSDDMRTFIVYDKKNIPLSVNVIHTNKPYATFVFAANSSKSKIRNGSHFIVDHVMKELKKEKFDFFDLLRIPVSNGPKNGIYIFKKGTRGNKIQYNGEWASYKNLFLEVLMFCYRVFYQKKNRY